MGYDFRRLVVERNLPSQPKPQEIYDADGAAGPIRNQAVTAISDGFGRTAGRHDAGGSGGKHAAARK
jgi:hypothetical protein